LIHQLRGHEATLGDAVFTRDGKFLVSSSGDRTIRFWDLATGREVRRLSPPTFGGWFVFSGDGKIVGTTMPDGSIAIRDLASGQEIRRLTVNAAKAEPPMRFNYSVMSWNGDTVAALAGKDEVWYIWSGTKEMPAIAKLWNAAISPDGRSIAGPIRGDWSAVRLFDTSTGREVRQFRMAHLSSRKAFSPDCRMLFTGSETSALLFEVATGRVRRTLNGHRGSLKEAVFSEDGTTLVTLSNLDGTALVWNLKAPSRSKPLTPKELETHWELLAGDDAARAYEAIQTLVAAPDQTVPFLRERLRQTTSATDLQMLRTVEVLEHIASSEARKLLAGLAQGAAEAQRTQEATAALQRLAQRAEGDSSRP
jgi:WD40 repeat protein